MEIQNKADEIEFIRWTGDNLIECLEFMGVSINLNDAKTKEKFEEYKTTVLTSGLKTFTHEGLMIANVGDYILKGNEGEFYPCDPDLFRKLYRS